MSSDAHSKPFTAMSEENIEPVPPVTGEDYDEEEGVTKSKAPLFVALFLALAAFIIALILSHFAPLDLLVITGGLAFVVIIIAMYYLWAAPEDENDLDDDYTGFTEIESSQILDDN